MHDLRNRWCSCAFLPKPSCYDLQGPCKKKLKKEPKDTEVEFKPYQGEEEGTFYVEHLDYYREEFLKAGKCPRITVSEPHCLKSLTVGKLTLKKEPNHGPEIREWMKTLNVPWGGEALPAASLKVLLHLLKPRRKQLKEAQRIEILKTQNYTCAECLAKLEQTEFHHCIPLQNSVAKQEMVAVCPDCHQSFTFNQGPPI